MQKWIDRCDAEMDRKVEMEQRTLIDGPITDMVWSLRRESLEAVRSAKQSIGLSPEQRSDLYRHRFVISSILRGVRGGIIDPQELETDEEELQTLVCWVNDLLGLQEYGADDNTSPQSQKVPD